MPGFFKTPVAPATPATVATLATLATLATVQQNVVVNNLADQLNRLDITTQNYRAAKIELPPISPGGWGCSR